MIFSELYSVYYNTVAKILTLALKGDVTERELSEAVVRYAFSESVLTIMPALRSERWQLLGKGCKPVISNIPTMPLTDLERSWLVSVLRDPRAKLFDFEIPDLAGVEPLFTAEDYKVYDRAHDGDPYADENYIANFKAVRDAIKNKLPLEVTMENRHGEEKWFRFRPVGFEYSLKDDKIRIVAEGCRYRFFNLGRIHTVKINDGRGSWKHEPPPEIKKELTLEIYNERNSLERVMLHFAHFEKRAERIDDSTYILKLIYYKSDEYEIADRILSFGPFVKATAPEDFVEMIKKRLISQKNLKIR